MTRVNIFLDDIREPDEAYAYTKNPVYTDNEWKVCRDHNHFVSTVKDAFVNGTHIDMVSFDHDLASEHYQDLISQSNNDVVELHYEDYKVKSGYDSLKWLLDFCSNENLRRPILLLHTMNPVGRDNMRALIANTKHR